MKPPRYAADLYADMRDRRLLPLVAILLIAIPAVPLLLSSETNPPPPAPTADTTTAESAELPTLPAVLASDPGLRDYRERLDRLSSKDPFAQRAPSVPKSSAETQVESVTEAAEATGTTVSGGSSETIHASTGEIDASTSTSESANVEVSVGGSGDGSGSGGDSGGGSSSGGEQSRWFTYQIDVLTGPAGDTQRRRNVERLSVLPSRSNPVALFLGVEDDGNRAVFMVSPDVVESRGDGSCLPDPAQCQFLTMEPGEERKFDYAPSGDADTFVIDLKDIRVVPTGDPRDEGDTGSRADTAGAESFIGS